MELRQYSQNTASGMRPSFISTMDGKKHVARKHRAIAQAGFEPSYDTHSPAQTVWSIVLSQCSRCASVWTVTHNTISALYKYL